MAMEPGLAARRSRRGYFYQDLYSLRCCLHMANGDWESVLPEGQEDVVCVQTEPPTRRYIQVKTRENAPAHWSVAELCGAEISGRPDTSILGRLFTGKKIDGDVQFVFATNEGVKTDLKPLLIERPQGDKELALDKLESALRGFVPPEGRTVRWCLERLVIECCEASADALEALIHEALGLLLERMQLRLLTDESHDVLEGLVLLIQKRARQPAPGPLLKLGFEEHLRRLADKAMNGSNDTVTSEHDPLKMKLSLAGFGADDAQAMEEMRLKFTLMRRRAISHRRQLLDSLTDEIAMACLAVKAARLVGETAPGMDSFRAVVRDVRSLWEKGSYRDEGVGLDLAWGALHDITGRCRNTYV